MRTLVLPKVHSAKDLYHVSEAVHAACVGLQPDRRRPPVQIVASIESAQAVHKLGQIAQWKAKVEHGGRLSALLVSRTLVTRVHAGSHLPRPPAVRRGRL